MAGKVVTNPLSFNTGVPNYATPAAPEVQAPVAPPPPPPIPDRYSAPTPQTTITPTAAAAPTPAPEPAPAAPAPVAPAPAAAPSGGGSTSGPQQPALNGLIQAMRDPGAGWGADAGVGMGQQGLGSRTPSQSTDILRRIVNKQGRVY